MSTIKVDNLQTTGGVGLYPARAWVNFNGIGTVSIRADGNVSSITDIGVGRFNVNFSSSLTSSDYSLNYDINTFATNNASINSCIEGYSSGSLVSLMTTSAVRVTACNVSTNFDVSHNVVQITL